ASPPRQARVVAVLAQDRGTTSRLDRRKQQPDDQVDHAGARVLSKRQHGLVHSRAKTALLVGVHCRIRKTRQERFGILADVIDDATLDPQLSYVLAPV